MPKKSTPSGRKMTGNIIDRKNKTGTWKPNKRMSRTTEGDIIERRPGKPVNPKKVKDKKVPFMETNIIDRKNRQSS